MKNIPIKFRGVSLDTGNTIYGIGVKDYGDNRVDLVLGDMALEAVKPDSVAQLVGYDVDGKEFYSGDVLIVSDVEEFRAMIGDIQKWNNGYFVYVEKPTDVKGIYYCIDEGSDPKISAEWNGVTEDCIEMCGLRLFQKG